MPMRMEENQEGQGGLPISSSFINIENRSVFIFAMSVAWIIGLRERKRKILLLSKIIS